MKKYSSLTVTFMLCFALNAQSPQSAPGDVEAISMKTIPTESAATVDSPLSLFETFTTGINTPYSEYGVALFRDKFITYSSRKIGALARKDPATNEPFTKLYCSDILEDYDLTRPLLFSSILNRNENLNANVHTGRQHYLFHQKQGRRNAEIPTI